MSEPINAPARKSPLVSPTHERDPYAGLPRGTVAEIDALADEQGVKPFDPDAVSDFWPQDEPEGLFEAELRRWRDEGTTTQP